MAANQGKREAEVECRVCHKTIWRRCAWKCLAQFFCGFECWKKFERQLETLKTFDFKKVTREAHDGK